MDEEEWRDKVQAGKKALLAYQKKKGKKKKSGHENRPQGQSTSSGTNDSSQSLTTQSLDEVSTGDDISEHQYASPNVSVDHLAVCDPLPTVTGNGSGVESSSRDNQEAEPLTVQEAFSSPLLPSDSGLGIPSTGEMRETQQRVNETVSDERVLEQEHPLYHDGSDATQVHSQSLEQSLADEKQADAEKEKLQLQIDALRVSHAEEMESYRKQVEEAANAQVQGIYTSLQGNFQLQQQQSQEAQSALLSRLDQEQSLRKAAEEKVAVLKAEMQRNTEAMAMTPSANDVAELSQKLLAVATERDHLRADLEAARQELESTLQASASDKAQVHMQLAEQMEEAKKSAFSEFEAQIQAVAMQLEESQTREAQIKSAFDALHAQHSDLVQRSNDAAELAQEHQKLSDTLKLWESRVKDLESSQAEEVGVLQQDWESRMKDLESSHAQEIRELQQDFENRLSDVKGMLEAEHQKLVIQAVKEKEDSLRNTIVNLEKQLAKGRLDTQELEASLSRLSLREAQVVDLEETNEGLVSQVESLNHRLEEAETQHRTLSSEKEGLLKKHADVVQRLKGQQQEIEEGIQACNEVQQQKHQLELDLQSLRSTLNSQAATEPIPTASHEVSADSLFNALSLKVDSALQQDLHYVGLEIEAGPESLFANLSSFVHAKSQEVTDLESKLKKHQAATDKTIRELTAENSALKQDAASLRNASVNPQSQLQGLTEDKSALESSLVKQRGTLQQKLAEKETLEQQLRLQQAELDKRQAQQSHLEALLEEKNRMEQELQSQKKALVSSLNGIQEKLRLTEDDAVEQQRRWEEEMNQAQSTIKQKEEALSQQQGEFQLQQAALSAQHDVYIHQIQENHCEKVKTIEAEAATSLKQREQQLVQHHEEEVGRLANQHSDVMEDMRRQHTQELTKKDEILEKLREDAQRMAQSLEEKVQQDLSSQKEALQKQYEKELAALEDKHLKERKELIQDLQCQFDVRLKEEVEQLQNVHRGEHATDAEQLRSLQEALAKEKTAATGLRNQVAERDSTLSENQQLVNDLKSLLQQQQQINEDLSQQLQQQQGDHDKAVQQFKADGEKIISEYQQKLNEKQAACDSKIAEYEGMISKLAHEHQLLQAQLVKERTSRAAAEEALAASEKKVLESYAAVVSSAVVDTAIGRMDGYEESRAPHEGSQESVATADLEGKLAHVEADYKKQVAELKTQLADSNNATVLMQKESQQQADAALSKLQQSLEAVNLEEVKKVKEELGLQKEMAVEDMAKQLQAATDEYNQFKAACEQECQALQEQLQGLQETVKTMEAVKIERDEALCQLKELSQRKDADLQEIKQTSEQQLSALQAQSVLEVEQLQHQLDHAQTKVEELRRMHDEQTLAQTKLQAELSDRAAECSRLKELSVIAANRSEDDTQRSNEVVLLRKDNEDLQSQISEWKEKACSYQEAITMYQRSVAEVYQLAIDVEDEELGSNGSTTPSESSSIEEHQLLEPSVQTLQDTAQFTEEHLQPDDTTYQSGFLTDISKGNLSMEAPGLDMTTKFERIQQVIRSLAHRSKKQFGTMEIGSVEEDTMEGVDVQKDRDLLVAKCTELEGRLQEVAADSERLAAATQHSAAVHADTLGKAESANAALLEEVATVTAKLQAVELELSKQVHAKEVIEGELARQRQLLADLQTRCGGLQDKVDEAHRKLEEGEGDASKVAELEVELQQKDDLIAQLAREREESSTIINALKHQHATELQHFSDTINTLKYDVTASKDHEQCLEQQLAAAAEEHSSVQEQLEAAIKEHSSVQEQLEAVTKEHISVQEQLEAATKERSSVQEQLVAATKGRNSLQEALAAAMDQLARNVEVDGQMSRSSAQEVENMQQQLAEHVSALSVAQERVVVLEKELRHKANILQQMESLLAEEKKEHQLMSAQLSNVVEEKERCIQELSELQSRLQSLQVVEDLDQSAGGDFTLLESQSFAVVDLSLLNRIRDLVPLLRSESAEVHALSDLKDSVREHRPSVRETELAGLVQRMQEALACNSQNDPEVHDWKKEFLDAIAKMLHEEHSALSRLTASTKAAPNLTTEAGYSDLLSHLKTQIENMQALHQVDRTGLLAEIHELRETVASLQRGYTDQLHGLQAQLAEASVKAHALENTCTRQEEALRQEKDRSADGLNEIQLALQLERKKYKDLSRHFAQKEQQTQQHVLEIGQELSKKVAETHQCTQDLVTARNDTFRLQEELNSQQLELQSALSRLAATRSQGLAQQEENGRLEAKLRQCRSDLSSARAQGGHLQEQLEQLQRELSVQGSLVLPSPEGFAFATGRAGMEDSIQPTTQSLHQMKAELSRIHSLYKKTENQRRALIFQKAYLTQQVDSFYYTQLAAFDILQEMDLVDVAALHSRRTVHTPRQHFRGIVWAVRAALRINKLFRKHKKA